jgi:hypothetical protein
MQIFVIIKQLACIKMATRWSHWWMQIKKSPVKYFQMLLSENISDRNNQWSKILLKEARILHAKFIVNNFLMLFLNDLPKTLFRKAKDCGYSVQWPLQNSWFSASSELQNCCLPSLLHCEATNKFYGMYVYYEVFVFLNVVLTSE